MFGYVNTVCFLMKGQVHANKYNQRTFYGWIHYCATTVTLYFDFVVFYEKCFMQYLKDISIGSHKSAEPFMIIFLPTGTLFESVYRCERTVYKHIDNRYCYKAIITTS